MFWGYKFDDAAPAVDWVGLAIKVTYVDDVLIIRRFAVTEGDSVDSIYAVYPVDWEGGLLKYESKPSLNSPIWCHYLLGLNEEPRIRRLTCMIDFVVGDQAQVRFEEHKGWVELVAEEAFFEKLAGVMSSKGVGTA